MKKAVKKKGSARKKAVKRVTARKASGSKKNSVKKKGPTKAAKDATKKRKTRAKPLIIKKAPAASVKRARKQPTKAALKKKKAQAKCPKCQRRNMDTGVVRIGPVYQGHEFGYRSETHHPYADHVSQSKVMVCMSCGFAEIYFDVDDLKRKQRK